jgi:predicted site-specific integrase-resolvase
VNLKGWAARQGAGYATARRWFTDGRLPVPARKAGGLILRDEPGACTDTGTAVVYARVSPGLPGGWL